MTRWIGLVGRTSRWYIPQHSYWSNCLPLLSHYSREMSGFPLSHLFTSLAKNCVDEERARLKFTLKYVRGEQFSGRRIKRQRNSARSLCDMPSKCYHHLTSAYLSRKRFKCLQNPASCDAITLFCLKKFLTILRKTDSFRQLLNTSLHAS